MGSDILCVSGWSGVGKGFDVTVRVGRAGAASVMPNKYQALQGDQHSSPPQEKNNKKLLLQFSSVMSVHLMDQ